jgi:hypothetical protein
MTVREGRSDDTATSVHPYRIAIEPRTSMWTMIMGPVRGIFWVCDAALAVHRGRRMFRRDASLRYAFRHCFSDIRVLNARLDVRLSCSDADCRNGVACSRKRMDDAFPGLPSLLSDASNRKLRFVCAFLLCLHLVCILSAFTCRRTGDAPGKLIAFANEHGELA